MQVGAEVGGPAIPLARHLPHNLCGDCFRGLVLRFTSSEMCGFQSVWELIARECVWGTSRVCTRGDTSLSPRQHREKYYLPRS